MDNSKFSIRTGSAFGCLILASLLSACGSSSGSEPPVPAAAAGTTLNPVTPSSAPAPVAAAAAPTISGSPATSVRSGAAYTFQPAASDANGDTLYFSINGKPAWATFDTTNGRLSGTPAIGDQGSFNNVSITVTDGVLSSSMPSFNILVSAGTSNSATLSWSPPTTNTDGSSLNNLAGYRIHYGTGVDALISVIEISNPGLTSYVVGNLNAGTYYFAVSAYTADGTEGDPSGVGSKTM